MGNAKEFKPRHGAFKLAAERLGLHRQSVERSYKNGKNIKVMAAVAKASLDIEEMELRQRRLYHQTIQRAKQLAEEANQLAATI